MLHISGYQIQYSLKKDFSEARKVRIKSAKTLTRTIRKLEPGKTYYVRIRTYKTVKNKNYYSAWSKAKKVKTKGKAANSEPVDFEATTVAGTEASPTGLDVEALEGDAAALTVE